MSMRWARYAGWLNIVLGIGLALGLTGLGLGFPALITGVTLVGAGIFMVWLTAGWDNPIEDLSELHKYGRPANAVVLAVEEQALDGAGGRTAKLKLNVAPVNESDFITTRTLQLPGGRVPAVGETVTVKFDPQKRKNVVLLEKAFMVEDHLTAANRMFSRGTTTTLSVVALALLVFAAPAGAVATKVSTGVPVGQVELAGQSVVFGSFGDAKTRFVRADPGGGRTVLAEYDEVLGGDDDECCQTFFSTNFSASATRVATSSFYEAYVKGSLAQSNYRLSTGPASGPLAQLFDCGLNHPYEVDGDRIAYLGDDCTEKTTGQGSRIVVRNLAAAGSPVVTSFPMTEQPNTIDLAGNHLALSGFFQKPPELRVYDLTNSSVAYKLDHNFAQYALQADGKLAVAHPADLGSCRIEWFSRAEPTPHRIDICPRGRVRMENDRIVVDRLQGSTSSLDVIQLNGNFRSVAFFEPPGALTGFDWDGSRVAYGVQGCVRTEDTVWTDDLTGNEPPSVDGGACIAEIGTKNARADRKGLVRVKVSCPDGCAGLLTLYSGKRVASRRSASFTIRPGGSRSVPIRLQTLRDVRARGSRVYSAQVEVDQRGGNIRSFKAPVRVYPPKN